MNRFKGFTDSESNTPLPDPFFRHLLKEIETVEELKVTAYALWRFSNMEGPFQALGEAHFDPASLGLSAEQVRAGLEQALERGTLLRAEHGGQVRLFLNKPQGQSSARAYAEGRAPQAAPTTAPLERPSVFRLYEENIGPLTPLIADSLKDAEQTYSAEWVVDAIEIAVKNNKRAWSYCEAILKRWKEEGRAEKQNRRDAEEDRHKYIKGEYADHIEH